MDRLDNAVLAKNTFTFRRMNKLMDELSFLFLQDEMEGLDLEGKTVEESTVLLEKPLSTVIVVNQGLLQFNQTH